MVWPLPIRQVKHFMAWAEWQAELKYRLQAEDTMQHEMCLTEISGSKNIFQELRIHGASYTYIRLLIMIQMRQQNIPCCTFFMEEEKIKGAGQRREKQTLFSITW